MTETNTATDSFTLTDAGTVNDTLNETGNKVTGLYTATTTGTDTYTLAETGSSGGGYSETVSGSESFTVNETGNSLAGEYERTTTGGGSYTLVATGAGLSNGSGTTGYTLTETANPLSGNFSQTQTGTTRYDVLQGFNNVADTNGSSTPGHLNFVPYGVAFVDPETAEQWFAKLQKGENPAAPNANKGGKLTLVDGSDHGTQKYNCFAWAVGKKDVWYGKVGDDYAAAMGKGDLTPFNKLFKSKGYEPVQVGIANVNEKDPALKGKDLIALYGFEEAGKITVITHAARKDKERNCGRVRWVLTL